MITEKAKWLGKGRGEQRVIYFCILNDFLDEYKATNEEKKKAKELGLTDYFQLFDDDGIKYYSGYTNLDRLYDAEMDEFTILNWAMNYAGCTEIKMRNKQGILETV